MTELQPTPPSRREDILQALARMLESSTNGRITTAALAKEVGFSEAALYRHFPSKAKMYEALLAFAEETLFSAIKLATAANDPTAITKRPIDIPRVKPVFFSMPEDGIAMTKYGE